MVFRQLFQLGLHSQASRVGLLQLVLVHLNLACLAQLQLLLIVCSAGQLGLQLGDVLVFCEQNLSELGASYSKAAAWLCR